MGFAFRRLGLAAGLDKPHIPRFVFLFLVGKINGKITRSVSIRTCAL